MPDNSLRPALYRWAAKKVCVLEDCLIRKAVNECIHPTNQRPFPTSSKHGDDLQGEDK
jgi:hypothetical protein